MSLPARPTVAVTGLAALASLFILVTLSSPSQASGQSTERAPVRRVDDSDRLVVARSVHPLARPQFDRGRSDPSMPMDRIVLSLAPRPGAEQELQKLLADQQDSASPSYHRWLTPEEFGARFGASDEDIRAVTDWLEGQGFVIDEVAKGRGWINFSGNASQVEAAFATEMHEYDIDGKREHANAIAASIPRGLSGLVNGVVSLNSFRTRPQHVVLGRAMLGSAHPGQGPSPNVTFSGVNYLAPGDFATIYNVNPLYDAGINGMDQTIAIVGRVDIRTTDVQDFRSFFGLPPARLTIIHNGVAPGIWNTGEETEADLDVQWSGAVAPNATIKFVVSKSTFATDGVLLSAQYIVNHNVAPVMSTSFGLCEAFMGGSQALYNAVWQQAAAQGITSFVSSGDSGAAGCDASGASTATHGLGVSGLSSTPFNVAVGGTRFNDPTPSAYWANTGDDLSAPSALSYIPETAWNESGPGLGLWSSGGGVSAVYAKPSFQSAPGVPADGARDVPDVSLTAAGHDGYLIFQADKTIGCCRVLAGTSASSPSFAGLMSLIVQKTGSRQGNANTTFYQLGTIQYGSAGTAVFHDVTTGNNSVPGLAGFAATAGYDRVTGLGSVDATALAEAFSGGEFQFSAANYTVSEATPFATITVKRAKNATSATVDYSAADGTATGGGVDYTLTPGTLTFAANVLSKTFQVPITKDSLHEGAETVLLRLSNPQPSVAGLGASSTAVLTITDNDVGGKVQLGATAYTVDAGAAAATAMLTVKRTGGMAGPVTVPYTMTNGTAVGGTDYDNTAGTVTFSATGLGAATQPISIPVSHDTGGAKTFKLTLGAPTGGASLGTPTVATVTILGTQPTLGFSADGYTVKTTQPTAAITVKRSAPLAGVVTVHYATSDGTATSADYTAASGDLTFPASVTTKTFTVKIAKKTLVSVAKTVHLTLSSPQPGGTAVLDPQLGTSLLTIVNPNLTPTVQFSAATYTVNEATPSATITVKRTGDMLGTVTVHYASAGGSAINGDPNVNPNADYNLPAGDLTFLPGQAMKTFPVPIVNDSTDEGTETALIQLSGASWSEGDHTAAVGAPGMTTVSITDNETTVQFAAASYSALETATLATISVKRTGSLTAQSTVTYAATGGSAIRDTGSGGDYALAPGILTFAPGQSVKTFPITLEPDTVADGTRTIQLTLSVPTAAMLGTPSQTLVTIKDNDVAGSAQFSAASYSVAETGGKATITVTRTGGTSSDATVHYTVSSGATANPAAGGDFDATSGTLTFGPTDKSLSFDVTVHDDGVPDSGAKSVDLVLDSPGNGLALGSTPAATLWIVRE